MNKLIGPGGGLANGLGVKLRLHWALEALDKEGLWVDTVAVVVCWEKWAVESIAMDVGLHQERAI